MDPLGRTFRQLIAASAAALVVPLCAVGQPLGDEPGWPPAPPPHAAPRPPGLAPDMLRMPGAPAGPGAGPMFLHGLQLSEAQQDLVFEILHAQAPALRAQDKALRAAQSELRALAQSDRYDEARARVLADAASRAMAETIVLRTAASHAIWQSLTPEQRRQAEQMRSRAPLHPMTPPDGRRPPRS